VLAIGDERGRSLEQSSRHQSATTSRRSYTPILAESSMADRLKAGRFGLGQGEDRCGMISNNGWSR